MLSGSTSAIFRCIYKLILFFILGAFVSLFFGCKKRASDVAVIQENTLFSLPYGNFDGEINLFSMRDIGDISTTLVMQDGFFFIVNGESQKILETNSYGDLLAVYYNKAHYEQAGNTLPDAPSSKGLWWPVGGEGAQFLWSGKCAIGGAFDNKLRFFVVASVPKGKSLHSKDDNLQLQQVIVVIDPKDGETPNSFIIGQEGVKGSPFPFIKNIFVTENNELVVVAVTNEGLEVFWYSVDCELRYKVVLKKQDIPHATGSIVMLDQIVSDPYSDKLFIKVDYYMPHIEADTLQQSGIDYTETLIYPFDVKEALFGDPVPIPPFTQGVSQGKDLSSVYKLPYDFLGVTKNGTFFFITTTVEGFNIEAVHGASVAKRNFLIDHDDVLYYSFHLAKSGIVSALLAYKERVDVVWWRCEGLPGE